MSATIVETSYGQVKGERTGEVYVWKGIPYAKPPLGSLRFHAPQSPNPWEGILDASQFGPVAPQPSSELMNFLGNEMDRMSEDCLYLNIWSPGADEKRRPVMVWIHGGAFISGSGSTGSYDGTSFAELGDVVVVTINYRLGIMGFLHLGELGGEEYAKSGNCGILDQIAALRWVKDNIAAFGGDPNRVTIFGESAGAMSIGVLLSLPSAKGLFSQAILQSGAARNVLSSTKATKVANKLLAALEVSPAELYKLADISIERLIEASTLVPPMSLGPVIDGDLLLKHPEEMIAAGSAKKIPILIGTNKDEYRLFTFSDPIWRIQNNEKIKKVFEQTFPLLWPQITEQFIHEEMELNQTLYDQLMTMHIFTYPALELAKLQVKQGAPVWMYRFDWESPVLGGALKACHALEIPFVWNTLGKSKSVKLTGNSSEKQEIANQMHHAWIAFAHSANPNTAEFPNWPEYDLTTRSTMIFNKISRAENDPSGEERMKWEKAAAFS